ncbi:unnamed protein product [Lactuca virosa]|uniref:Uncharacterized protein n=1 Tax=Lactuca virosa TaxID=75947 RepID=A0AAU9MML2_9ASTR|nr:unnamed protein product [Lactuca virosa]
MKSPRNLSIFVISPIPLCKNGSPLWSPPPTGPPFSSSTSIPSSCLYIASYSPSSDSNRRQPWFLPPISTSTPIFQRQQMERNFPNIFADGYGSRQSPPPIVASPPRRKKYKSETSSTETVTNASTSQQPQVEKSYMSSDTSSRSVKKKKTSIKALVKRLIGVVADLTSKVDIVLQKKINQIHGLVRRRTW